MKKSIRGQSSVAGLTSGAIQDLTSVSHEMDCPQPKTQMLCLNQRFFNFFYSCLCSLEVRLWFCTPKVHGSSLIWAIEVFLFILHHFGGVWGSNPAKAAKYLTFFDMTRHGPATLLLHSHLVLFDMPWV